MRSHDFGQFVFNRSILNEEQIKEVIKSTNKSKTSLAVAALFLQLLKATELNDIEDDFVCSLITPRQLSRISELKNGQSLIFAQALIDNGIANFLKLDHILESYRNLEIPPIESALTSYYDKLKRYPDVDFPFAVDVVRELHEFLSDSLQSSVVILPPRDHKSKIQFGASVKIVGAIQIIVALLADEEIFLRIAKRYDSYVETVEDAYDAISELLNVFTGQFVVQVAVTKGLEEVPEPPRYGSISNTIDAITLMNDIGNFNIYIGKQEIFDQTS